MKKIVLSLVVVLGVVLLTGCGGKLDLSKTSHIICRKTETKSSDITTTVLALAYDENEKITDFKVDTDIQYTKSMSPEAIKIVEKAMKLIGSVPGVNFESKVGDNSLYYSFSGNISMLKTIMKQTNKDYDESKVTGDTKAEALKELPKDGYTCEDYVKE